MKLQVMSDLHLEFGALDNPVKMGDVLLLAGDIMVAEFLRPNRTDRAARKHRKTVDKFLYDFVAQFDKAYMVLGNHEHYHGDFYENTEIIENFVQPHIKVLHNKLVPLNDTHMLWGGTFWTDFNNNDWFAKQYARKGMTDFEVIYDTDRPINIDTIYQENKFARMVLEEVLRGYADKKLVVMTHHGLWVPPTNVRKFPINVLDPAYWNTGTNWVWNNDVVTHVIHGHTHDQYDYMAGNVRVICNPRGYKGYEVNKEFNLGKVIEL